MDENMKNCPYCGEEILKKAIKCKHCGEMVEEKLPDNGNMKKCTFCAEMTSANDSFCNFCESSLADTHENYSSKYEQNISYSEFEYTTTIPEEVKKWNWGAFWVSWIWGICNKSYLTFLVFIPFFGFLWMLVCGAKGNEWAWKNKKWSSVEEFNQTQYTWALASNIIATVIIAVTLVLNFAIGSYLRQDELTSGPYDNAETQVVQEEPIVLTADEEQAKIEKAVKIYKKAKEEEGSREVGISVKCYQDYYLTMQAEGHENGGNIPCSAKEIQAINNYLDKSAKEAEQSEYTIDTDVIYGNAGMPKTLALKDVPIICFEKANIGDDSRCTTKQLETIKAFFKEPNKINWGQEYFSY